MWVFGYSRYDNFVSAWMKYRSWTHQTRSLSFLIGWFAEFVNQTVTFGLRYKPCISVPFTVQLAPFLVITTARWVGFLAVCGCQNADVRIKYSVCLYSCKFHSSINLHRPTWVLKQMTALHPYNGENDYFISLKDRIFHPIRTGFLVWFTNSNKVDSDKCISVFVSLPKKWHDLAMQCT